MDLMSIISQEMQEEFKGLDFQSLDNLPNPEKEKEIAWLKERKGRFTGSEAVRLMGYEDKSEFPSGALTYATEVGLECVTKEEIFLEKNLGNAVEWGKNTEIEACEEFMKKTGLVVSHYGKNQIFSKKGDHFGATCDGHILNEQGKTIETIETKCPDSKTHHYYWHNVNASNFKKELTKYYWQMQTGMWATGANLCWFISYDPRFISEKHKLFIVPIQRNDEDINKFRRRLSQAISEKERIIEFYK